MTNDDLEGAREMRKRDRITKDLGEDWEMFARRVIRFAFPLEDEDWADEIADLRGKVISRIMHDGNLAVVQKKQVYTLMDEARKRMGAAT